LLWGLFGAVLLVARVAHLRRAQLVGQRAPCTAGTRREEEEVEEEVVVVVVSKNVGIAFPHRHGETLYQTRLQNRLRPLKSARRNRIE